MVNEKDTSYNDTVASEQYALMDEISQDLNLSQSQDDNLRGELEKSHELHAHPASLWKLAATLYDELSVEQLEIFLNHKGKGGYYDHSFNAEHDEKPHSNRYFDYIIECLTDLIEENQKEEFNAMIESHNNQKINLRTAWENGELTLEAFKADIFALKNHMELSIKKLLTDEQQNKFEVKINELKQTKYDDRKKDYKDESAENQKMDIMKEEMFSALGMTGEQIDQLETLKNEFKSSMEIINQEFLDGSINDNTFINSASDLFINIHESKMAVFTDKQQTVILIHHILTVRAHGKYKYWRKK